MALKTKYANQGDIPEALRPLYTKQGSAWVLEVESDDDDASGGAPAPDADVDRKLREFRTTNLRLIAEAKAKDEQIAVLQKRTAAIGDAGDDDVSVALKLLSQVQNQADSELIKKGDFEQVVARRMKGRETDWQKKIEAAQAAAAEAAAREAKTRTVASDVLLDQRWRRAQAAKKLRVKPTAEDDVAMRFRRDWKSGDDLTGEVVPGHDKVDASDPEAWFDSLVSKAPHLFEGGEGGGTNKGGGQSGGGKRTFKRSDLSDKEYAGMMKDISDGKVTVVMGQ